MGSGSAESGTKGGGKVERGHLMLNETSRRLFPFERFWLAASVLVITSVLSVNAQSTSHLTPLQKGIEVQRQRLTSDSEEERRDALLRLGAMRVPEASRVALAGLLDSSVMVRVAAVSAIRSLPADDGVVALLPLLAEKDEFVRRETAYALGHTKSRKATSALIERVQGDKEDSVKAAAIVALGEIGDETAVVPLAGVLAPELSGSRKGKRERNVFVLRAAAEALGQIRSKAGAPALIAALSNDKFDTDVRREAARALGQIGDPSAIPALQNALSASDPYLASTADKSLKMISR